MGARRHPDRDIDADFDEHAMVVTGAEHEAAGVKAVLVSLQRGLHSMGAVRTAAALARLNQRHGFDCPGCAWPEEHGGRKLAEFCENGAKAVAEEATKRVVTPEFFARHSMADLTARPEYWLSQQGRSTRPVVLREGDDHYLPIAWDEAYRLIADDLRAFDNPNEALFYASGRTSNEAAFLYQLMVRSFGTNNLPDCSNMCHESSGTALIEAIGIGKGSVTVEDVTEAGVKGGHRVVFVNPADIEAFGLSDGDRVDLVSEFTNGDGELQELRAKHFMVVAYSTPRGNAAAYYPETDPLVALDHVAKKSNTPVSKAIVLRLEPAWGG